MTTDEMRDAIAALQDDLAELRRRVWELEQARDVRLAKRARGTSRFRAGYPHGLGKGHE